MNRFVNRIISCNGSSSMGGGIGGGIIHREEFKRQLSKKKLIWFGEFHSEQRIVAFLNDTVLSLSESMKQRQTKKTQKTTTRHQQQPKIHIVMEHFSIEMQDLLDKFQADPSFGFQELKKEYKDIGTEGHGLDAYRSFLLYCKNGSFKVGDGSSATSEESEGEGKEEETEQQVQDLVFCDNNNNGDDDKDRSSTCSSSNSNGGSNIRLYGGFIPRPYASRWNKAESVDEKRRLLEELYEKDLLPPPSSPMHDGLWSDRDNLLFNGNATHFRLLKSMMSGDDLYDESIVEEEEEIATMGTATPIERIYQAQLLKDHAMGYMLSKLLLEHHDRDDDKFIVVAGIGHLKHMLGVPECLELYLRSQILHEGGGDELKAQKAKALDALLNVSSKFSALVGCQMLYETCIEDEHKPLEDAIALDSENEDDDDDDDANKKAALKDLFLNQPKLFDKLVLGSEIIQQRMINYDKGTGNFKHPSCDYCYVYDEDDDNLFDPQPEEGTGEEREQKQPPPPSSCPMAKDAAASAAAKAETMDAYNSVGESAFRKGNLLKAKTIMKHLHYTDEDMELIGDDHLYNFQGVANPHREANLRPGEHVLDLGSGLGVDSFLAAARVGLPSEQKQNGTEGGTVTGVDLAPKQVAHSNAVAKARKVDDRVTFVQGDAEKLSQALQRNNISSSSNFDVCISNGAFCLIPNKETAFREIFRVLKPGGRMAVSTTTIQDDEGDDDNHAKKPEWPICMKMFANLSELKPMCEKIGFDDVRIVDAESSMEMEFSEEEYEAVFGGGNNGNDNPDRFKIHGKDRYGDQYEYLEKMDMDELCKVVTVCATKPTAKASAEQ